MAKPSSYDVAVIGSGIGGYVSAIRASQLGKRVVLIEKDKIGGTCANWGCIPTKSLLATTNLLRKIRRAEDFGIHAENITIDLKKAIERKDAVVSRLVGGIDFLIRKNNITLVKGQATFLSRNKLRVERVDGTEETLDAENIVIAAGAEEPKPPYATIDEEKILSSKGALRLEQVPKSLTIIGGGVIGIEFAQMFKALGSEVRILEASESILPTLDTDLSRFYQRQLKKEGIEVNLNTEVKSVRVKPNGRIDIEAISKGNPLNIETEKVLIVAGRVPSTRNLGLEKIGVQLKDGFIAVNEQMRTSIPNIYAIGDVTGQKMFAHAAVAGGIIAAENIAGLKSTMNYRTVPTCMYCSPEVASVGLSEDEAKSQGYNVAVGKFPLTASGRALTLGEEREGFAKVVCDAETGEVLGVHLMGANVTEIIGEAALAIQLECTSEELGSLVHAHPTISEALMEAARDVTKKAIQI